MHNFIISVAVLAGFIIIAVIIAKISRKKFLASFVYVEKTDFKNDKNSQKNKIKIKRLIDQYKED